MSRRTLVPSLLLLLVHMGCGSAENAARGSARLTARLAGLPVVYRVEVPGLPSPTNIWAVRYAVEIGETACVGVTLTYAEVEVIDEGFGLSFGLPDTHDQARLTEESASRVPACGTSVVLRGGLGTIGGGQPRGPARVIVRVIGTDDEGNGVGLDWNAQTPVEVTP